MGIREKINQSKVGPAIGVAMILVAIGICYAFFKPTGMRVNAARAYYTDDDGQSYFEDTIYKFPPFDHNGKTAVMAIVYEDAHNNKFVGYLKRFTPEAQKQLQEQYTNATNTGQNVQQVVVDMMQAPPIAMGGTEVKLPGASNQWIPRGRMMYPPIKMPDSGDAGTIVVP
jgi:hypothetical protein